MALPFIGIVAAATLVIIPFDCFMPGTVIIGEGGIKTVVTVGSICVNLLCLLGGAAAALLLNRMNRRVRG